MNRLALRKEIERLKAANESNESLIRSINGNIARNKEQIKTLSDQLNSAIHLKGSSRPDLYND